MAADTPVDLVVPNGAEQIDVPDVTGQTQATDENTLVTAGLTIGVITSQHSSTVPTGDVISQNPVSYTPRTLPTNRDVLVFALGAAPKKVTDVTGQPQATAASTLRTVGLTIRVITSQPHSTVSPTDV